MAHPNWTVSVDTRAGGRCYLSRNAYLNKWLAATGRLRQDEPPDIVYTQPGYNSLPSLGQKLTAVQSVTYVSDYVATMESVAAAELKLTVEACREADLILAHSEVHKRALISVGISDAVDDSTSGRIEVVRPAPAIPVPRCSKAPRPLVVGYAGQDLPRKRLAWARMAAERAGVPLCVTNSTRFGAMGTWYDNVGLVAVPSTGESWSMVVSEAIAHGVPAVCTDQVGAAAEVIETGAGLVCDSEDMDEFCLAVWFVLNSSERFSGLARRAPLRRLSQWARDLVRVVESRL